MRQEERIRPLCDQKSMGFLWLPLVFRKDCFASTLSAFQRNHVQPMVAIESCRGTHPWSSMSTGSSEEKSSTSEATMIFALGEPLREKHVGPSQKFSPKILSHTDST